MKRIKLGDIFEINTPEGKAYLHYIYRDESLGELIRVLPGLYVERPTDFNELAASKEMYMIFFPLPASYRGKMVELVGYYPADKFGMPKYMREELIIRGEFLGWYIINIRTRQRKLVKTLTKEQKELSSWGTWNGAFLIEMLTNGWTLENWGSEWTSDKK
ncbi:hypothetical protein [Bacteroides sp. UBA939]|uniref:hypothetical protein n=1 Tax=Bacteroides sp. UBA939 TaxID=1946092 RepID=UPI0025BDFC93|nr:hypothetical protein [Bacteroides sp. UBA939]